jgi:hypothetical protein
MFLPLAIIVAPMINTAAMCIGLLASAYALPKNWYSARWMINLGVPSDLATGHLVFLLMQLPTVLVLVLIGTGLFHLRNRYADQIAIVSLLAVPFVDAYLVSSSMEETQSLLHEQSSTIFERGQFALTYLHTQLSTALVLIFVIATYILGRRRTGYSESTQRNTIIVFGSLSVLIRGSWALWSMT